MQSAINAAQVGDTIQVASGIYREHLVVNKSVTLRGEDRRNTVIDGGAELGKIVVLILANSVNVSGFTVRNGGDAIRISNSSRCNIRGNNVTFNDGYGIYLDSTSNSVIEGNAISSNLYDGIQLFNSSGNTIANNTIAANSGYGIYSDGRNTITNNTASNNRYGIYLSSRGNLLRSNRIENNTLNFGVEQYSQDVDASNTVNEKRVYYWINQRDREVPTDAGYVAVINSTRIKVGGLTLKSNWHGVLFVNTTSSVIRNVSITDNRFGILFEGGGNNTVDGNVISSNYNGIQLFNSSGNGVSGNAITLSLFDGVQVISSGRNRFVGNTVSNNSRYGIYLQKSSGNLIYGNNFLNNRIQLYSLASSNTWDNGAEGNYWSDYAGKDPDGDGVGETQLPHLGVDYYPLIEPWRTIRVFGILWGETTYYTVIASNSTISRFSFSQPRGQMSFNATGPSSTTGFCNISIPLELLGGSFTVLVDGASVNYVLGQNSTHSSLYFTYSHTTRNIKVKSTVVIKDTIPPTARAPPDLTVNEDSLVALNGSASSDNVGVESYVWTFLESGKKITLVGPTVNYIFTTPGIYSITLNVTDAAGNYGVDATVASVLDVTPPKADAGGDQSIDEGASLTLNASKSSDNVGIVRYEWTFGDGTNGTGVSVSHIYAKPGRYNATLTVKDARGNSAKTTIVITIRDVTPPLAEAGENKTVTVGEMFTLNASRSVDNVGIVSYEWDLGDGTTGTGIIANHVYTRAGTYAVKLTVKDAAGNRALDSITVIVREAARPPPEGFSWWIVGAVAGVSFAIVLAYLARRRVRPARH